MDKILDIDQPKKYTFLLQQLRCEDLNIGLLFHNIVYFVTIMLLIWF